MSRPGRDEKLRIMLRRNQVATIMARGVRTAPEIAVRLGLNASDESVLKAINRDKAAVCEEWRTERQSDVGDHVDRKLAEIRAVRDEAMAAWERSKAPKETRRTHKRVNMPSSEVETRVQDRDGEPRYLVIIQECDRQERELLGLDAPKRLEHSGTGGGPITFIEVGDSDGGDTDPGDDEA